MYISFQFKFVVSNICKSVMRIGSRIPTPPKMELFVAIVKGWKTSEIATKGSILDVTGAINNP